MPQIEVAVNLAAAAQVGLKPGDVRRAAATLVAGEEVGDIFRAGRAYDVVVWSTPATRDERRPPSSNLPIDTPSGAHVRLGDVADVSARAQPRTPSSARTTRAGSTSAPSVEGRDLGSVVAELNDQARGRRASRAATTPRSSASTRSAQAAQSRLLTSAVVAAAAHPPAAAGVLRQLAAGVLVFLTLPMALVGGVLAAWLAGGILSLGSLVGFFTVFGIAARNGILLINHCQHLEQDEGEPFGLGLVLRGAKERLAPILMTSLATGLALVPLVVLGDRPGHEIEYPLAVVILGGLVTSTLLNLFVVPSLYLRFHRPLDQPASVAGTEGEAHAT